MEAIEINQPAVNDFIRPDLWSIGAILEKSDNFSDSSFPGCAFYVLGTHGYWAAVNVTVTGRRPNRHGAWRCKIEFVGDGEPSTFTGGTITFQPTHYQRDNLM